MANVRIKNLPADAAPNKNDVLAVDSLTTRGVTIENAVKIGRPFASQAEAEAGTDYTKAMNPLTVAQAIAAQGGAAFATAAQGAKADSAVQPGDLAAVATSGAYADLLSKPTLGTAAATAATDYATATQGAAADTAVQSIQPGISASVDATDPNNPIINFTGTGTGDVLGPSSATDGNVPLFDGTTGKLVKDGGATGTTGLAVLAAANVAAAQTALGTPLTANTMLVDNAAGTARESKSFQEVVETVTYTRSDTGATPRTLAKIISEAPYNVRDFGYDPASSDFTPMFKAAISAIGANGGSLYVPRGQYRCATTPFDLLNSLNIRIFGDGGGMSPSPYLTNSTILATNGYAPVKISGCQGIEIDHIELTYTTSGYTSGLVSVTKGGTAIRDNSDINIHHCRIAGTGQTSSNLVTLNGCYGVVVEKCSFNRGLQAIIGAVTGQFANTITIRDNFFGNDLTQVITIGGNTWNIENNVFELNINTGSVSAIGVSTAGMQMLNITHNHFDDGGTTGSWINLDNTGCANIRGNWFKQGQRSLFLASTTSQIDFSSNYIYATESSAPIGNGGVVGMVALNNKIITNSGSNVPNLFTSVPTLGHGIYDNGAGPIIY